MGLLTRLDYDDCGLLVFLVAYCGGLCMLRGCWDVMVTVGFGVLGFRACWSLVFWFWCFGLDFSYVGACVSWFTCLVLFGLGLCLFDLVIVLSWSIPL